MEFGTGLPYVWKRMRYQDRVAERQRALDNAADRLVDACRSIDDVHAVYAFGSYGRGDIRPESDLDALIVRKTDLPVGERQADLRRRLVGVTTGLDLVVVRPDEYSTLLAQNSFGQTILRDARLLAMFKDTVPVPESY